MTTTTQYSDKRKLKFGDYKTLHQILYGSCWRLEARRIGSLWSWISIVLNPLKVQSITVSDERYERTTGYKSLRPNSALTDFESTAAELYLMCDSTTIEKYIVSIITLNDKQGLRALVKTAIYNLISIFCRVVREWIQVVSKQNQDLMMLRHYKKTPNGPTPLLDF